MSKEQLNEALNSMQNISEEMTRKVIAIDQFIEAVEKEAYAKGMMQGLGARVMDLDGKTLVIKTSEDPSTVCKSLEGMAQQFNARIVVLNELDDLIDLHEVNLKAIGLQKIKEES